MHAARNDHQAASSASAGRSDAHLGLMERWIHAASPTSTLGLGAIPRARIAVQALLQAGARSYVLRDGLALLVEHTPDGHVVARHAGLEISGEGRTARGALEDFASSFDAQYRALVECDPARLTRYARRLRESFERAVAEVAER